MINKTVLVILTSLIFLSFRSDFSEGFSANDQPFIKKESITPYPRKITAKPSNLGDSSINYFVLTTKHLYNKFNFHKWNKVRYEVFEKAYQGYLVMKAEGMISNSRYLTIMDFEYSANQRRIWVLDLQKNKIALHDLVSHGKNSGEEYAHFFSNQHESYKSSLGFYVTGTNYIGKNDYSLRLHGVEEGFNDNAYERGIVMHGADYVNNQYIRKHKRLGRSQGCPAVSQKINTWLINTIEGGSCLFIYYPDQLYLKRSEILNTEPYLKDFPES